MAAVHLFQDKNWSRDLLGNSADEIIIENFNSDNNNGEYALIRKKKYKFLPCYSLRITFGPQINYNDNAALDKMLGKLKEAAKKHNAVSVEFNPYVYDLDLAGFAKTALENNFSKAADYVYKNSIIVDLSKSEDELFKEFERRGQKAIRQSVDRGVSVELVEINNENFEVFYNLYKATCERTKFIPEDFFTLKKQLLFWHKKAKAYLFFAFFEKIPIGALLLFNNGNTVSTVYQGNDYDPEMINRRASNAMYWESMKWAKANGFLFYDFGGVTVSEPGTDEKKEGIHNFKTQFGGRLVHLPGNYEYINKPFMNYFIRLIMPLYSAVALGKARAKAFSKKQ